MNQIIIFALVLAVAAAAPQRPLFGGHQNRPGGLFGQPGAGARPPALINPLGSGSASGAGTASANAAGLSVSGVAITSAQNGGAAHAVGHGTASENVLTGEVSGTAGGSGESQGRK